MSHANSCTPPPPPPPRRYRKRVGGYDLKNLRSNFWVSTPRDESSNSGEHHGDSPPTSGMGVFSSPMQSDPALGEPYDSLSPKDIEEIVGSSAMRDKAYSFPLYKADNVGSSFPSPAQPHDSGSYAPALVHRLADEDSPLTHVYEDPVIIKKASTLPTRQQHLVDPSDYLLPSPTEKSMTANLPSFNFSGGQKQPSYEVPPGVKGPHYTSNPDVAAPQYSNTLDMSDLEGMRDKAGYSPLWSHSEEKKDLDQDGKHSSLSNSVKYATPKRFPAIEKGANGGPLAVPFGYEVMPTSPEPPEPADTHYGYTSSTPIPENLQ